MKTIKDETFREEPNGDSRLLFFKHHEKWRLVRANR